MENSFFDSLKQGCALVKILKKQLSIGWLDQSGVYSEDAFMTQFWKNVSDK